MILRQLFTLLGFKVDKSGAAAYQAILKDTKTLAVGVSAAVVAVGAGIAKAVADFADFAGDTVDTATKIGTTTTALQELDYAAVVGGASVGSMREALNSLGAAASGVTARGKQVRQLLAEIGVSATDSSGKAKTADVLFEDLTRALEKVTNPGKRAAIAMRVLGGSGEALVPLLAKGSAGLAELREEAQRYGTVISEDAVNAGDDLGDNLDRLKLTATGLVRTITAGLAPAFNQAALMTLKWFESVRGLLSRDATRGLVPIIRDITNAVGALVSIGGIAITWAVNLTDSLGGLRNIVLLAAVAFAIWNVQMLPLVGLGLLVAGVFALIFGIIEDVALFNKYGDAADTLTGRLKKAFFDESIKPEDSPFIVFLKMLAQLLGVVAKGADGAAMAASDLMDALGFGSDAIGAKVVARKRLSGALVGTFATEDQAFQLSPDYQAKIAQSRIYRPSVQRFVPHIRATRFDALASSSSVVNNDQKQVTINVVAPNAEAAGREVAKVIENQNMSTVVD